MYKILVLVVLAIALVVVKPFFSVSNNSVAIIDLDKVANEIGRSEIISSEVQAYIEKEKEQLQLFRDELTLKLNNFKQEIGAYASEEETQQLLIATRNAEIEISEKAQRIQQEAEKLKIKLVFSFKEEMRPIIRNVAQNRQFNLVEITSPAHLYINPKVDISDDVIDIVLELNIKGVKTGIDNIPLSDTPMPLATKEK